MASRDEGDILREQINCGVWELLSDEDRRLRIDLYQRGLSSGADLPKNVRRGATVGLVVGKAIYLLLIAATVVGVGYLGFWLAKVTLQ